MNEGTIRKNIDESMIRINLIADPEYIVGEDKNVHCYLSWMNKCNNLMMGSVVWEWEDTFFKIYEKESGGK